jgi:hypothetical protein
MNLDERKCKLQFYLLQILHKNQDETIFYIKIN